GGITHAILHLLYSRFWCKVMRDLGLVKHDEPIARLFTQGMVQKGGVAMSKSRGNVVGAEEMAQKYGADTGRLYTLFAAPPEKDLEWSEESIEGAWRFLNRVFRLVDKHSETIRGASKGKYDAASLNEKEKGLLRKAHQTLRRVTSDFETRWHFNSAIALVMELTNEIYGAEPLEASIRLEVRREVLELLTLMLAPMTPHLSEELWEMLGHAARHDHRSETAGRTPEAAVRAGRRRSARFWRPVHAAHCTQNTRAESFQRHSSVHDGRGRNPQIRAGRHHPLRRSQFRVRRGRSKVFPCSSFAGYSS